MDSVLSILSSVLSICCSRSSSEDGFNSLEAQAHQSSSPSTSYSSSSTTDGWCYDVFLSFRGEDTRKNFTDHLYTALERAGVKTFRDDKLKRGEPIAPSLLKAIENSRSSIAVFSRNYASSKWCLDELAKMVECRDRNDQTLFPIFFDVDPSDVRNQTGSFAKAFCQHEKRFEKEKVEKWRGALREVGQLSGWSLKDVANGLLQDNFHCFHPMATILSYLTKAPLIMVFLSEPPSYGVPVALLLMKNYLPLSGTCSRSCYVGCRHILFVEMEVKTKRH